MNLFKPFLLPAALTLFMGAMPDMNTYTLFKDYTVTLHGTSNLHSWDEKVEKVSGDARISWNNDLSFDLNGANIIMEAHSIKSEEGSIMNNNTYRALKADAHPEISFQLTYPLKSVQTKPGGSVLAKGSLTIAGVTRFIDMPVNVFMREKGKLAFEGAYTLKMTDYGIEPPTALFGTLKTGNDA